MTCFFAKKSASVPAWLSASLLISCMTMAHASPAPTETDLAALRYFQSIGDTDVAQAEMRRLQAMFPSADIAALSSELTARSAVDVGPIWALIEKGEFDQAEAIIAEAAATLPGWQPPADLRRNLSLQQGLAGFDLAYAANDLPGALDAVAKFPEILTCDVVDTAWRVSELMVRVGNTNDAFGMLSNVVRTCKDPQVILASLQKAHAISPGENTTQLAKIAKAVHPDQSAMIDELTTQWRRATRRAKVSTSPVSGAQRAAAQKDWTGCIQQLGSQNSVAAALQRGWCQKELGHTNEAAANFQSARANGNSRQRGEASYGLALTMVAKGQIAAARDVLNAGQMNPKQRTTLQRILLSASAQSNYSRHRYMQTVSDLNQLESQSGGLNRGQVIMKGWALVKSNRWMDGVRTVEALHDRAPGADTRVALSDMLASR